MITETTSVPAEISGLIDRVQADSETLHRELTQALDVWRETLDNERKRFESLLQHKENAWQEQEAEWQRQRQIYEQRIEALQSEFDTRLRLTEQNALRSLNELDDSWQRDKLEWQRPAAVGESDVRPQMEALHAQLVDVQAKMAQLQQEGSNSSELFDACLKALDFQIQVLYDLVHFYASAAPAAGDAPLADR